MSAVANHWTVEETLQAMGGTMVDLAKKFARKSERMTAMGARDLYQSMAEAIVIRPDKFWNKALLRNALIDVMRAQSFAKTKPDNIKLLRIEEGLLYDRAVYPTVDRDVDHHNLIREVLSWPNGTIKTAMIFYLRGFTMKETGAKMGSHESRISQLIGKGILKLKRKFGRGKEGGRSGLGGRGGQAKISHEAHEEDTKGTKI
ncbi:MAG: hypothetical protein ABSH41_26185 [Syntrophobacteraceae bacterium]